MRKYLTQQSERRRGRQSSHNAQQLLGLSMAIAKTASFRINCRDQSLVEATAKRHQLEPVFGEIEYFVFLDDKVRGMVTGDPQVVDAFIDGIKGMNDG